MTNESTPHDAQSIVASGSNPYALNTSLKPVDWKSLRERFDPQGEPRLAADIVDTTFTIVELKPFESGYVGGRRIVYWVKAIDNDGELFHTVLGGQAVCDVLDAFASLNATWHEAVAMGDGERGRQLEAIGAGRPITVTLRRVSGGKFGSYYILD